MSKRLQVVFSEEAWAVIESIAGEANKNFDVGSVTYSDVVNEMALSSKVDIKSLQLKHTNIRRSLRVMASKDDVDLDSVIKTLLELKAKTGRKKMQQQSEEAANV